MSSAEQALWHQVACYFTESCHGEILGGATPREMTPKRLAEQPRVAGHECRTGAVAHQRTHGGNRECGSLKSQRRATAPDHIAEDATANRREHCGEFAVAFRPAVQAGKGAKHPELHGGDRETVGERKANQRRTTDEQSVADDHLSAGLALGKRGGIGGRCGHVRRLAPASSGASARRG